MIFDEKNFFQKPESTIFNNILKILMKFNILIFIVIFSLFLLTFSKYSLNKNKYALKKKLLKLSLLMKKGTPTARNL